jgi:hypothetical protein
MAPVRALLEPRQCPEPLSGPEPRSQAGLPPQAAPLLYHPKAFPLLPPLASASLPGPRPFGVAVGRHHMATSLFLH